MPPQVTPSRREHPRSNTDKNQDATTRVLLAAGVVGPILFVITFTVAGWLRPGYSAMASAISDLGVGPMAWIQNANFVLFGILLMTFAVGIRRAMSTIIRRSATWGAIMIATAGVGMVGAALFPAAPPTDALHFLLGFLIFMISAVAAMLYTGHQLRRLPEWRALSRYSTWTAVSAIGLVLLMFIALNPASPLEKAGIGGLIQRLFVLATFAWYMVTGWWLSRVPARAVAVPAP